MMGGETIKSIAIFSQVYLGHLFPAVSLSQRLMLQGYSVCFYGHGSVKDIVEGNGVPFKEIGWSLYPDTFIEHMLKDIMDCLTDSPVSLIICDSAQGAPAFAAEKLGIPWVSFQSHIPLDDSMLKGGVTVNDRLRHQYLSKLNSSRKSIGLPALENYKRSRADLAGLSPYLHLVMIYPEMLLNGWRVPDHWRVVGAVPGGSGCMPGTKPGRAQYPRILISTSSSPRLDFNEKTEIYLKESIEGLRDEYDIIVTTDDSRKKENYGINKDSRIHWNVQQPSHHLTMPYCDAAILHGGCGTIQKAIYYGLPMVIIPLGADHSVVAGRCNDLGIAIVLQPEQIDSNEIAVSVKEIVGDPSFKTNALKLSEKVAAYDAVEISFQWISELLKSS